MPTAWKDGRPPKGGVTYSKAPIDDVPTGRRQTAPLTGFRDDEVSGNQTNFTRGTRAGASPRELAGMAAVARPLKFKLPPGPGVGNLVDKTQDLPFVPANHPHEHK